MATVQRQTNKKRRSRFLSWLFPEKLREGVCSECGRPYMEHPNRAPTFRFSRGNVEVFVYRGKRLFHDEYLLRVGVWRLGVTDFQLGQLFGEQEFDDLRHLVAEAVEFAKGCKKVVPMKTPVKMSSPGSITKKNKEDYGQK